ncbi:vacuolar ATP synthase subunit G [Capsaspora owczarzaki ATCC 30864]|uniref:V-type proton ATPase subunit G n=1 Tax=Capsaspora owczarzaki (strain ATCC 30864) TaxID=595528 RepID=A0A0D2WPX6_CAPO3|nr:vacuolar ATP synthase subunit G [Capsaspora owczarzaki ATCC 30864]KJE93560.1 vacuolar ATP synthase subunit G [Capsaspora owczarzaki ATCC 30864]|eukprot:XP_004348156.1 vacuolar ATP synthase subunit G [Capsaspora owczarzaki ATCC 30864]
MSNQSQGIQALLAAEKSAAEIVAKARKRKATRLKQAKDEAEAEIAAFKSEREAQFQAHVKAHEGDTTQIAQRLKEETNTKLVAIDNDAAQHKQAVINKLLEYVCDVKAELHINVRD